MKLRLLPESGDCVHSEMVGRQEGMETVIVVKDAFAHNPSVHLVYRDNSEVECEFHGNRVIIFRPVLEIPLIVCTCGDGQFTLRYSDYAHAATFRGFRG